MIRHEQQPGIGLALRMEIFRRRGLIASTRQGAGPALDTVDHEELNCLLNRLDKKLGSARETGLIRTYPIVR